MPHKRVFKGHVVVNIGHKLLGKERAVTVVFAKVNVLTGSSGNHSSPLALELTDIYACRQKSCSPSYDPIECLFVSVLDATSKRDICLHSISGPP
jgi:hypothetical protein